MKKLVVSLLALALSLTVAAPAFATGVEYGQHHASHAREMGGFTGTMNPGVKHQGYSGWAEME